MPLPSPAVSEGLRTLGIRNLLLGIHDPAFPSAPEEDFGRGTPYSEGAGRFLAFARSLGFDGVQLGPQGVTSPINPSPYDGSLFSRNPLSIAFLPLTRPGGPQLLAPGRLAEAVSSRIGPTDRVPYRYAYRTAEGLLYAAWNAYRVRVTRGDPELARFARAFGAFRRASAPWLERDGLYEGLRREYEGRHWRDWRDDRGAPHPDRLLWAAGPRRSPPVRNLLRLHAEAVAFHAFGQFILAAQHRRLRRVAGALGLTLFGDLQVGMSERDAWYAQSFVLGAYRLGAPPSRTNPEGQAWGYPVLDPKQYAGPRGGDGPAVRFLRGRVRKLFREFDGVRIDHPHGLICPWVYRADEADALAAVRAGARLFASPDLPDHPELAHYALARPDQLDRGLPRYADAWVRELADEQVDRYGVLLGVIVEEARRAGREPADIACEVLSTQPYPLRRTMERHGLGRFRVTQKAHLSRADDVYRSENARPEDWIMMGNHDTPPIRLVAEGWVEAGEGRAQAEYLAWRLLPEGEREGWIRQAAQDPRELVQARFAELFAGPAQNVMVFVSDLFGYRAAYNRPGTVDPENWSLRVRPDYEEDYAEKRAAGDAPNLPRALATALRAPGAPKCRSGLVEELEHLSADGALEVRPASVATRSPPGSRPSTPRRP